MSYFYEVSEWQVCKLISRIFFLKDQLLSNVIRSAQVRANLLYFREYQECSETDIFKQIG